MSSTVPRVPATTTATRSFRCLLLSRQWRDGNGCVEIVLWGLSEEGPVKAIFETRAVMFVPRDTPEALTRTAATRTNVELRTLDGEAVDAVYFTQQSSLLDARDRLRAEVGSPFESDVKPSDRYVMERFVTGAFEVEGEATVSARGAKPVTIVRRGRLRGLEDASELASKLSVVSLDIETDGPDGALLSYALAGGKPREGEARFERVVVIGAPPADTPASIRFAHDERALLRSLLSTIEELDPDVIIGWNVVEFDLMVLERRCAHLGLSFAIGRNGETGRIIAGDRGQVSIARIPGRVVLDGIATLKNATWSFERFTLEYVARELLGRGKKIEATEKKLAKIAEIQRMAREDPLALAAYNLEDARLVAEIFERADLVGFACARAQLVGLPLDRQGGSVAAFDHCYLPRLHRAGFVAADVGAEQRDGPSPGGEVLASVPGLHRDVLSFDFRSLYPSIIRTFRIDPLGLATAKLGGETIETVEGYDGARFAKEGSILPSLIERLTIARKAAIAAGNEALSRAIKIQMNSFYGVLGTPGCRFFDPRLASSITRRGHQVIHRAKRFFEERGLAVLYGDTDSVFVHVEGKKGQATSYAELGRALALELNATLAAEIAEEHGVESALELRFESHYLRFLMPTVRGSEVGSKKRYAGAVEEAGAMKVVLRGLEAVRTDWTQLARRAQRELIRRVFADEPWQEWLRGVRRQLFAGELDHELVYKKRVRRDLDLYAAAPPHVRAARIAREESAIEGDALGGREDVEYVMTRRGPMPLESAEPTAPIDYPHYVDKQLAPACDVVLSMLGTSFARVAGSQLSLF